VRRHSPNGQFVAPPAPSVRVLPGLTRADRLLDPAAYCATEKRVVEVCLKDGLSAADKLAMARWIAAMPEVEAYHFVSKVEALRRFRNMYGQKIVYNLPVNPLPASSEILVREQADIAIVARRFYGDPMVDNAPGTHNGVPAWGGSALLSRSPSPSEP
jgi:hypothetical protein